MWVSVWEEVDGPRLRKLAKMLSISRSEALGILNFLWLWCLHNANDDGLVIEADRPDLCNIFRPVTTKDPDAVVDALMESGWIAIDGKEIFINFWAGWQKERISLQRSREKAAERMRQIRLAKKKVAEDAEPEKEPQKPKAKKQKQPEKKMYAEFVSMTEAEHEKLVSEYGEAFTAKLITTLDNYKGSSGKKYKNDYRAILTWTVDRVKHDYPGLLKASRETVEQSFAAWNPFEEWVE